MKKVFFLLVIFSHFLLSYNSKLERILQSNCTEKILLDNTIVENIDQIAKAMREKGNKETLPQIPKRILQWGSNGYMGMPWQFKNSSYNQFFISIFNTITTYYDHIKLTPHDLFHAHVINFSNKAKKDHIAMVFHAKEYPFDIDFYKSFYQHPNEIFFSFEKNFNDRNFIYYSPLKNYIFLIKNIDECSKLFDANGKATVSEEIVAKNIKNSKYIGDINLFLKDNIDRIKYNFSFNEQTFIVKSGDDKRKENSDIDIMLKSLPSNNILYFLTGKKK